MNEIIFLLLIVIGAAVLVIGLNVAININIALHEWADSDPEFTQEEEAAQERALHRAQYAVVAVALANKEGK